MKENKGKHILIVDDELELCQILCSILKKEGYKVSTANNGEEAIDAIKKENIDLIIMDVVLPGINGLEAYSEIHKMDANLPTIVLTGYGTEDIAKQAEALDVAGYVTKPFKNEHLINLIKGILSKKGEKKTV